MPPVLAAVCECKAGMSYRFVHLQASCGRAEPSAEPSYRTSLFPTNTNAAAARIIAGFPGRIGVVLSGGGARGSYEAGVLLAFQDAQLPTHILAASSVGSINAASYAANSSTLVGNAEPLLDSWAQVTPPAVGIDWQLAAHLDAAVLDEVFPFTLFTEAVIFQSDHRGDREAVVDLGEIHVFRLQAGHFVGEL